LIGYCKIEKGEKRKAKKIKTLIICLIRMVCKTKGVERINEYILSVFYGFNFGKNKY
jgi:hypothetical protein